MLWDESGLYYAPATNSYYQQGDIVIAPATVVDADVVGTEQALDVGVPVRREMWGADDLGKQTVAETRLGQAIIVTHDCSLDKEFNRRFDQLRREGSSLAEAQRIAESDSTLDRFVTIAPVVPFAAAAPSDVPSLQQNRVIGYFPVCACEDRHILAGVADLSRNATIDRDVIVNRLGILSQNARATLLYALVRYWAYRAPKVTYEIEAAIGKRIIDAEIISVGDLGLLLTLDDGSELRLLQAPSEPADGGGRSSL